MLLQKTGKRFSVWRYVISFTIRCYKHLTRNKVTPKFFNVRGLILLPNSHVSPLWDFWSSPRFVAGSYTFCDDRPFRCGGTNWAFIHWSLTVKAWLRSQFSLCGISGDTLGLEQVSFRIVWFSPVSIIPAVFHTQSPNTSATNILVIDK